MGINALGAKHIDMLFFLLIISCNQSNLWQEWINRIVINTVLFFKGRLQMKQKYAIERNKETGNLTIKEYAELDKGLFSLIFEETYPGDVLSAAIKEGPIAVISAIRTPSLYPIAEYAEKIAEKIIETFDSETLSVEPVELVFNDVKLMQKGRKEVVEVDEDAPVEIDDLLHDVHGADVVDDLDDIGAIDDADDLDDVDDVDDVDDGDVLDEE